jgi:hypothetical protein
MIYIIWWLKLSEFIEEDEAQNHSEISWEEGISKHTHLLSKRSPKSLWMLLETLTILKVLALRFSQLWMFRSRSPGVWRHVLVIWKRGSGVSRETAIPVLRVHWTAPCGNKGWILSLNFLGLTATEMFRRDLLLPSSGQMSEASHRVLLLQIRLSRG